MAPYIARMVLSVSRHGIEHDIELARKMISENGLGLVQSRKGKSSWRQRTEVSVHLYRQS